MRRTAGGRFARLFRRRGPRARTGHGPGPVESLESRVLLSAGDLDATFAGDGAVNTDIPSSAADRGRQIALQADGKVLEVAFHIGFGAQEAALSVTRFNANGSVDTSFGQNGIAVVDVPGRGEQLPSIALGPAGQIYVGTWSTNPPPDVFATDSDFLIARLTPAGALDPSFDGDGIKLVDFGTAVGGPGASKTFEILMDLAVQADGRVVAAGMTSAGTLTTFGLARLLPDGSLDPGFNGAGVVNAPLGTNNVFVGNVSVTIDALNRIIVAGGAGASRTNTDFAVARYNPDGTFDTSFAGTGWTLTPFGATNDAASDVAVMPDNRIVAAGAAPPPGATTNDFAVVRYNPDGSLDPTFSGDGKATFGLSVGTSANTETLGGVALAADGSVVLSGTSAENVAPRTNHRIVVRLTPAGNPDPSFGANGVVETLLSEVPAVLVRKTDGAVYVGGILTRTTFEDFAVERLTPGGQADGTFGQGGLASADFPGPGFNIGRAGTVQADGKVIAAGDYAPNSANYRDLAFVRYDADGLLDPGFGTGGWRVIDVAAATGLPYNGESLQAVAVDAQGRIVFAGYAFDSSNANASDMIVGRLRPGGSLDTTFGPGTGIAVLSDLFGPATTSEEARDLLIEPDGSIVVAGKYSSGTTSEFAVARLDSSGSPDSSFGNGGALHVSVNGTASEANAVTLIPDQAGGTPDLIVAGKARNASNRDEFALLRLNADGSLDTSFDGDGVVTTPMGAGSASVMDVIVDGAGKIVAAGAALNPATFSFLRDDFALARYTAAGALDTTFDGDGKVTTDFNKGVDHANSIEALADGSYVAGGEADAFADAANSGRDFALVRYGPNGALVSTFGTGGKVMTNIDPTPVGNNPIAGGDEIYELLLYPGDRVVAVGSTSAAKTGYDFSTARYLLAAAPPAQVTGEFVFYNHSAFDGNDPAVTDADLNAIAPDKVALRPGGTAGFNNVTSYSRGLNGLMLLFQGETSPTADDFVFRAGAGNDPSTWAAAPAPSGFRVGPMQGGVTVLITFPDGALRNTWLQVTVLANDRTRLAAPHVFYFGNLVGNSDSMFFLRVDTLDVYRARYFYSTHDVTLSNRYDFNRDGVVNVLDQAIARANVSASLVTLTPPAAAAANIVRESSVSPTGLLAAGRAVPPRRSILQT